MNIFQKLWLDNQKAWIGGIVALVLQGLLVFGISEDVTVKEAVSILVTSGATGISVWFKKNQY